MSPRHHCLICAADVAPSVIVLPQSVGYNSDRTSSGKCRVQQEWPHAAPLDRDAKPAWMQSTIAAHRMVRPKCSANLHVLPSSVSQDACPFLLGLMNQQQHSADVALRQAALQPLLSSQAGRPPGETAALQHLQRLSRMLLLEEACMEVDIKR